MVFGGVHLDSDGAPCSRLAVYRGISAFLRAAYTPKRCEAEGFEQLVDRLASNAELNMLAGRIFDERAQHLVSEEVDVMVLEEDDYYKEPP